LLKILEGIQVNRWTGDPEKFLQKFRKELGGKKVALFVCCGTASSDKPEEVNKMRNRYLEEKAVSFGLKPVALGFFGGVINYNTTPWWVKRVVEADRPRIEATYQPTAPGIYDLRDWNAIRSWARELAQKTLADT
jgi:menaquinone-dependent protoporphyrinogen IX oxidase